MVQIRLTNTKTRRKEVFEPIDPRNVRMYVCGPTVYDRAHLGNARPVVVFDVLFRLLRHVYGEGHVTYVRNFTDVDDKINARAAETGRDIRAITDETIRWYHEDMDALGALRPTHEPRATEWIGAMVAMIGDLIAKEHAYEREGHVLFRVRSYAEYGSLSGRSVDDMMAGARVEVAPYKEDPLDFVLWKPSSDELPGWDSPWGRGRPGWHIECSAMARELLGASFDIHGGGLDLQFPHHENEIAQSVCAHPGEGFANVWMHNEMLLVEGEKMSKSLGNFFTVRDLLDQGVTGEVIRYLLLSTHYGKPSDWNQARADEAAATLERWEIALRGVTPDRAPDPGLIGMLAEDLDTAGALAMLHKQYTEKTYAALAASLVFMGFSSMEALADPKLKTPDELVRRKEAILVRVHELYSKALGSKDFGQVDAFKQRLNDFKIKLSFTTQGVSIGSVEVAEARRYVFHKLKNWQRRQAEFGSATAHLGGSEYAISAKALAYYYVAEIVPIVLQELEGAGA